MKLIGGIVTRLPSQRLGTHGLVLTNAARNRITLPPNQKIHPNNLANKCNTINYRWTVYKMPVRWVLTVSIYQTFGARYCNLFWLSSYSCYEVENVPQLCLENQNTLHSSSVAIQGITYQSPEFQINKENYYFFLTLLNRLLCCTCLIHLLLLRVGCLTCFHEISSRETCILHSCSTVLFS